MKTVHQKSQQTQTSDEAERHGERCAPATGVPHGVIAPDQMVIRINERYEPFADAHYKSHDNPILEVRLSPTGQQLPVLASTLRKMADNFDALYVAFCRKRQVRVDAIRTTAEALLALPCRDREQALKLRYSDQSELQTVDESRGDDFDDDIPF